MHPTNFRKPKGFTLFEIMIVIGIFAVISGIGHTVLSQYINAVKNLEMQEKEHQKLQKLFTFIDRDFRYISNRSVRNQYGDPEPAFELSRDSDITGELVRFSTSHFDYRNIDGRITRVAWSFDNGGLYRHTWPVLDRTLDTAFTSVQFLTGVDDVKIEIYRWDDTFNLRSVTNVDDDFSIPFGIGLTFIMTNGYRYHRLFDIANGT